MDVEELPNKQRFRGKLYALSEESAWEDTGTGYVCVTGSDENRRLIFRDEESDEVLHDRPVFSRDTYQLQGEGERLTIIVWEDPEMQKDWALSFQDPNGTTEVWEAIRREPGSQDEKRLLPLPTLGTLGDLSRLLTCVPPSQREPVAAECMAAKFVSGLREAFHTAEDLGSEEQLTQLWQISKGIFLLSNQKLTERYLQRDIYEDIMGMLEYDELLPLEKRIAHRQVLRVKVHFQEPVQFEDADTLERIHLNYRLQYLKDIVLPRILDDAAFVSLTQMIHGNLSVILDHIQKNAKLLDRLFAQIQQKDLQAVLFLQDVCRMAKMIPPMERQALYDKMIGQQGRLFEALAPFVADFVQQPDGGSSPLEPHRSPPRHLAVEVTLLSTQNDPSHLRRFLTSEGRAEGRAMLSSLIRLMHTEDDQGVQGQIFEMLRNIMDPATLEQRERDPSLDVFYERGAMDEIVMPLQADTMPPASAHSFCFAQQLVCELLAFAVAQHGYRARVYVMRHGLAQQATRLMASHNRALQLAPVRVIRAMIMTKDDAYHRYILKAGLFAPLLRNLQMSLAPPALGGNLLVSATLELLEFIRVQNLKILVDHVCRKHDSLLQEYSPKFKTFEGLMLKHQQNLEYEAFPPDKHAAGGPMVRPGAAGGQGGGIGRVLRSPGRDSDDDDEAYFESLEDDYEDSGNSEDTSGAGAELLPGADEARQAKDVSLPAAEPVLAEGSTSPGLKGLLGGYEDDEEEEGDKEPKVSHSAEAPVAEPGDPGTTGRGTDCPTDHGASGEASGEISAGAVAAGADGDGSRDAVELDVDADVEDRSDPKPKEQAVAIAENGGGNGLLDGAVGAEEEPSAGQKPPTVSVSGAQAIAEDKAADDQRGPLAKAKASAKAAAGRGEAPSVVDGPGVGVDAATGNVVSEKSLNHVPKRLKTSTAA